MNARDLNVLGRYHEGIAEGLVEVPYPVDVATEIRELQRPRRLEELDGRWSRVGPEIPRRSMFPTSAEMERNAADLNPDGRCSR